MRALSVRNKFVAISFFAAALLLCLLALAVSSRHPGMIFSVSDGWVLAAPAFLFLFYLISWFWIGPEPKPGVVVARYEPPEGLSPAAVRYVTIGTTDGRSFAAVIAQLAQRGCLRVDPSGGKYKLSRLMSDRATESTLAPEEARTLTRLFADGPVIELSPSLEERNTAQNGGYVFSIHQELTKYLGGKYLTRHLGIIAIGVLFTFASALLLAVIAGGREGVGAVFFTIWILFCGLTLGLMIELSFASAWKMTIRARTGWVQLLPGTGAIAVFGTAIYYLLTQLAERVSLSFALMLVAFLAVNLAWGPFLKRRTPMGREVADQIAGFRQFLQTVEQDPLNRLNAPHQSTEDEDISRFLPYAIALDVKAAWGDHLAQTFITTSGVVE